MTERETDNSTGGNRDEGQDTGRGAPERDQDEFEAGTGYQPSTNQTRDEPLPASHHDDGGQETGRGSGPGRDPSPRGPGHGEDSRGRDPGKE